MKRTIRIFGKPCSITFHQPTNEEYNTYANALSRCIKDGDDEALVALRSSQFDKWAEDVTGIDKAGIPDKLKSSVMFQVFDLVEVDEKN